MLPTVWGATDTDTDVSAASAVVVAVTVTSAATVQQANTAEGALNAIEPWVCQHDVLQLGSLAVCLCVCVSVCSCSTTMQLISA